MCEDRIIPITATSLMAAQHGSTAPGSDTAGLNKAGLQSLFVDKASVAVTAADSEAASQPEATANGDSAQPGQQADKMPAQHAAEDDDGVGELEQPVLRSMKSILKTQGSSDSNPALRRAVSWHDFEGRDLHTVKEFTPSEHDDDEVLFQPEKKGACCVIS